MHIPENYLSSSSCAVMGAAMVPVWAQAVKKVNKELPKEKNRLLASVLSLNPDVLILDEPYAGLDKKTQEWLTQLLIELKASGKTIIVASHSGELLSEAADETIVMK